MQVLCIRENRKWPRIHSGRMYQALDIEGFFYIEDYQITNKEFLIHFRVH